MSTEWKLTGNYIESCNCEAACPCVFLSPPNNGECTVLVAWNIKNGSFGDVSLDGLNISLAVHSPGHMAEVKWKAALYLDDKANDAQQEALTKIFGGQAGGHPAMLASHVGEMLGVKNTPMEFNDDSKKSRSLKIGDIANFAIEAIEGQGGAEVTVNNHPLCISPGNPAVVSRASVFNFNDYGLNWEFTNKNGFFSPFEYHGA